MERTRPCQQSAVQDRAEARKPQLSPLILAFPDNTPRKISSSAVKGQRPVRYFGAAASQHRRTELCQGLHARGVSCVLHT